MPNIQRGISDFINVNNSTTSIRKGWREVIILQKNR